MAEIARPRMDTEMVCQRWVNVSPDGREYGGFSLHVSLRAMDRYLRNRMRPADTPIPDYYGWIDWLTLCTVLEVPSELAAEIRQTEEQSMQFGPEHEYPPVFNIQPQAIESAA